MSEKQHIQHHRSVTLIIFCLLLTPILSASDGFSFRNITMEQGLTSNTVNCIFKDSKNFIWLGTANGLNRFDGFNIISFDFSKNKSVVSISEPDDVNLYICSEKELLQFNRKERKAIPLSISLGKSALIKTTQLDKDKNLYIVTNEGLFKLSAGTTQASKITDNLIKNKILTDILIDDKNICWLTTLDGLIKYDLNNSTTESFSTPVYDKRYLALTRDGSDIYIGTQNGQILIFNTNTNSFTSFLYLKSDYIQNISLHKNKLYVGTNGAGLKIVDIKDKSVKTLKHNPPALESISSNAIYAVLIDDHSLWIGTFSGGFNYSTSHKNIFKVFNEQGVLNTLGLNIRSFKLNGAKQKIYGTRNGLIYNSGNTVKYYNIDDTPDLKSNIILCIQPYESNYFIGTYGGGLRTFDTQTIAIKPFRPEAIFNENSFYSILQDKKGVFWFGTLSGLIKYDIKDNSYEVFNTSNSGLIKNDIHSILEDSKGRIWIATREGVCYLENGKIQRPDKIDLSFISVVRYLYEDSSGNIWLGCENEGAVKIDKDLNSYQRFTTNDFLPDNYISSIIEGQPGYLWLTTAKGIVCYNLKTAAYYIFSLQDGIPGYAFNDGAVQKTKDGTIWWGNEKGLVYLDTPNIISAKREQPYINITSIFIDGYVEDDELKNLPAAPEYLSSIKLSSSQNSIVFRFSDLEYNYPQSGIYEYKLEGIHENWQREVGKNEIVVQNPPSGTYELLIRKAGSEEPIKVITIIKPKSYTVYIWIIAIIIIIGIFILIYKRLLSRFIKYKKTMKGDSKAKYQNIKIEKNELESIKNALTDYMEKDKPYLNPDFKLDDIANAIQCPKTKVSQVLNQYLNTNFSNFVTKYRIEAFKEKAAGGLLQQYTLSALAKECGFSSRSSFFHSMKKLTGQTPLEFLKDAGIEIDKD